MLTWPGITIVIAAIFFGAYLLITGIAQVAVGAEIVASVLCLPLELTAVEEGAAYGAALLGGVAAGVFTDVHEAVAACVRVRERLEPNDAWRNAYEAGYARHRALYPALRPLEES